MVLALASGGAPAHAKSLPDTLPQPPEWRTQGGVLSGTLEIKRAQTFLGGRPIQTLTYNGAMPGPTWRVKPGDRLKVRLINNATLSVAPRGD